jgi:hypothetical protein
MNRELIIFFFLCYKKLLWVRCGVIITSAPFTSIRVTVTPVWWARTGVRMSSNARSRRRTIERRCAVRCLAHVRRRFHMTISISRSVATITHKYGCREVSQPGLGDQQPLHSIHNHLWVSIRWSRIWILLRPSIWSLWVYRIRVQQP